MGADSDFDSHAVVGEATVRKEEDDDAAAMVEYMAWELSCCVAARGATSWCVGRCVGKGAGTGRPRKETRVMSVLRCERSAAEIGVVKLLGWLSLTTWERLGNCNSSPLAAVFASGRGDM